MKKILLLWCVSLSLFGCGNFLDINPDSEVVNDDMFDTAEGVEDALYGVYMSMVNEELYGGKMSILIPELLGQNFITNNGYLILLSGLDYENSYAKSNTKEMWEKGYLVISYLNNIIDNLNLKSEKDFTDYNLYRGEALGLRAAIHFDLLRLFAVHVNTTDATAKAKGIPYVTRYTFQVTPFSSVDEVYSKIIADLKEAEICLEKDKSLMPAERQGNETGFTGARVLHFNYYAAQAMLARVYWMKGDLQNAKKYADLVIKSEKFTFVDKESLKTFMKQRVSLQETIWGLYTSDISSYLYDQQLHLNKLILPMDYEKIYSSQGPEPGKDERLTSWFLKINNNGQTSYVFTKIMDENNNYPLYTGGGYLGLSMIRIPEMYYIMAEALLEEGNEDEARVYLDSVVAARGMVKFADRGLGEKITLDDILNEWRKEFFGEGQWWYCQKRLNMDVYVRSKDKIYKGSDKIYTLPLPVEETDYH